MLIEHHLRKILYLFTKITFKHAHFSFVFYCTGIHKHVLPLTTSDTILCSSYIDKGTSGSKSSDTHEHVIPYTEGKHICFTLLIECYIRTLQVSVAIIYCVPYLSSGDLIYASFVIDRILPFITGIRPYQKVTKQHPL